MSMAMEARGNEGCPMIEERMRNDEECNEYD